MQEYANRYKVWFVTESLLNNGYTKEQLAYVLNTTVEEINRLLSIESFNIFPEISISHLEAISSKLTMLCKKELSF